MRWSDIPFTPPVKTLRRFAVLAMVILVGVAGWQFYRDRPILPAALLVLACVLGVLAWLYPMAVRPIFVGMMVLAFPINWVVTHVMLAVIFYCLFTPIAVLFRLLGRDPLGRRLEPAQDSYWVVKPQPDDVRSYFRQS